MDEWEQPRKARHCLACKEEEPDEHSELIVLAEATGQHRRREPVERRDVFDPEHFCRSE